jgi:hypothetical protein
MNPKLIKAGEVSKDMPVGVESVRHHRLAACRGIQLLASVFKLYATSDSRRNCTTHTSSREGRFYITLYGGAKWSASAQKAAEKARRQTGNLGASVT